MSGSDLNQRARDLFLTEENTFGCAEVALITLQEHFGLSEPMDSTAAMALNGGVAYSGATCGAITGAAMAVGRLAGQRIPDHREAKGAARRLIQRLMEEFAAEYGATDCRDLTGYNMLEDHDEFIESGVWRDGCMRQIEFAASRLGPLLDPAVWEAEMARSAVETAPEDGQD